MRKYIPTWADLVEFLSLCRFLAEARVAWILGTRAVNTEGWQWFGQLMLLLAVVATAASGMAMQVVVHVTADKHPVDLGVAVAAFSVLDAHPSSEDVPLFRIDGLQNARGECFAGKAAWFSAVMAVILQFHTAEL
ncbi:hypothetical protein MRX96_046374 [Rhipicephalus microplus]